MTTAWLVGLRLRPDRTGTLRDRVVDRARVNAADGVGALLPPEGVATVTVCLEDGERGRGLWWYVELTAEAPDRWDEPADVVRSGPLFDPDMAASLTTDEPLVFGQGDTDGPLAVHATNPDRPRSYRRATDRAEDLEGSGQPRVLIAEDGPTDPPEVYMVTYALRGGPATWFARGLTGLMNRVEEGGRIERQFEKWTEPVIEDERMWTETAFYDRGSPDLIRYWMECDSLETVWEGFHESSSTVTRVSEVLLGWIIQHPERVLTVEGFETDFETLVHAVSPER